LPIRFSLYFITIPPAAKNLFFKRFLDFKNFIFFPLRTTSCFTVTSRLKSVFGELRDDKRTEHYPLGLRTYALYRCIAFLDEKGHEKILSYSF
jgi:hypothetical protein